MNSVKHALNMDKKLVLIRVDTKLQTTILSREDAAHIVKTMKV